jgi:hypothetical protein
MGRAALSGRRLNDDDSFGEQYGALGSVAARRTVVAVTDDPAFLRTEPIYTFLLNLCGTCVTRVLETLSIRFGEEGVAGWRSFAYETERVCGTWV